MLLESLASAQTTVANLAHAPIIHPQLVHTSPGQEVALLTVATASMRPRWGHRDLAVRHRFVLIDEWYTRKNRGARCKESAGVHQCRPPHARDGGGHARARTTRP